MKNFTYPGLAYSGFEKPDPGFYSVLLPLLLKYPTYRSCSAEANSSRSLGPGSASTWAGGIHRRNHDSLDCVRSQLEHNASHAWNHNALRHNDTNMHEFFRAGKKSLVRNFTVSANVIEKFTTNFGYKSTEIICWYTTCNNVFNYTGPVGRPIEVSLDGVAKTLVPEQCQKGRCCSQTWRRKNIVFSNSRTQKDEHGVHRCQTSCCLLTLSLIRLVDPLISTWVHEAQFPPP